MRVHPAGDPRLSIDEISASAPRLERKVVGFSALALVRAESSTRENSESTLFGLVVLEIPGICV
jgi:hypothetical protein